LNFPRIEENQKQKQSVEEHTIVDSIWGRGLPKWGMTSLLLDVDMELSNAEEFIY
jgi:predicted NAD-dependent protein-ADP-ribosyltransferase YbiA (DUF1768 family)